MVMDDTGKRTLQFVCVIWFLLAVAVVVFLRKCADRQLVRPHTYILVGLGAFSMCALITLVPFDLALALETRESRADSGLVQDYQKHSKRMRKMYAVVYWTCLTMSTVCLPFTEQYNASGHVTGLGRWLDAAKKMAVEWVAMLAAFIVFLAIVFASGKVASGAAVQVAVVAATNTAYSLVVVSLLGVGLVELPKAFWLKGSPDRELARMHDRAAAEFAALKDASVVASAVAANAIKTLEVVERSGVGDREKHGRNAKINADALSRDVVALAEAGFKSSACGEARTNKSRGGKITDAWAVADMRRDLAAARAQYNSAEGAVERVKCRVYYLEDVQAARLSNERTIKWGFGRAPSGLSGWRWHTAAVPVLHRFCGIAAAAFSCALLTSEIGAAVPATRRGLQVSAFAAMAHLGVQRDGEAGAAIASAACLGYMVLCLFKAVSLMKIRGYLDINARQRTPPRVLSFAVRQVGTLAAPLAYNYLATMREVGQRNTLPRPHHAGDIRTSFARFYVSKMGTVTGGFDRVAACLVVVVALLHAFNVLNLLLVKLKLGAYQFGADLAAVDDAERRDGQTRLARDRQRLENAASRGELRAKADGGSLRAKASTFLPARAPAHKVGARRPDDSARQVELVALPKAGAPQPGAPQPRAAWLEKRSHKGALWNRRFFALRSGKDGPELVYFKNTADTSGSPAAALDLRSISTVRAGDDGRRFDVDLADRRVTLRCASREARDDWVASVKQWRDYATDGRSPRSDGSSGNDSERYDVKRPARASDDDAPALLSGELQLKARHAYRGDTWTKRYVTVDAQTAQLQIFKKQGDSAPQSSHDLRLASSIQRHGTVAADANRFDVEFDDGPLKLKAKSRDEATKWIAALAHWRDHLLLGVSDKSILGMV
ncbi:hypothetical protein M885DRAFT_506688 [Pelagophyceae sp. CCMP2097]|nr:hypothetical protein M885DRAFT_506688 [Pelagophyceae sp. CCMP2097]|mmetsp:Transcript_6437/g.20634  ORF Transcript_6437/g.20634 Transcript_6437/m.20634 type:complete len:892 (-) Transcript_6437:1070-3745(-)